MEGVMVTGILCGALVAMTWIIAHYNNQGRR